MMLQTCSSYPPDENIRERFDMFVDFSDFPFPVMNIIVHFFLKPLYKFYGLFLTKIRFFWQIFFLDDCFLLVATDFWHRIRSKKTEQTESCINLSAPIRSSYFPVFVLFPARSGAISSHALLHPAPVFIRRTPCIIPECLREIREITVPHLQRDLAHR